jgi:hypothetical protein
MAELDFPTINGHAVSWANIELQVGGIDLSGSTGYRGFKAISYKTTVERSEVRGAGREIISYTDGNVAHESSVTWIFESYHALVDQLGAGFMDKQITLTVSFKLADRFRTVEITTVGMKEAGGDFSQGTEGLEIPMPLDTIRILYDGQSPVTTTEL